MTGTHNNALRSEVYAQALRRMTLRYECLVQAISILRQTDRIEEAGGAMDEMARQVLNAIAMGFAAENCSILLLDEAEQYLNIRFAFSPFEEMAGPWADREDWRGWRFRVGEGVAGRVAERGEAVRIGDVSQNEDFLPIPQSPVEVTSLLCFPLKIEGKIAGILNLSHSQPHFFTEENEHTLSLVAERVARFLCGESLRRQMQEKQRSHDFVVETVSDGVLVLDSQGRVLEANPAARLLLDGVAREGPGEDGGDAPLTEPWLSLVHPDDRTHLRECLERTAGDSHRFRTRFRLLCEGGAEQWMEITASPVGTGIRSEARVIAVVRRVEAQSPADSPCDDEGAEGG